MNYKTSGGSAFPSPEDSLPGMTLRDWFAGQALAGWIASTVHDSEMPDDKDTARGCYEYADAMIEARDL